MKDSEIGALVLGFILIVTYYLVCWVSNFISPMLFWLVPFAYFGIGFILLLFALLRNRKSLVFLILALILIALGLATLCGYFWNVIIQYYLPG